jgi:hypothetical protein
MKCVMKPVPTNQAILGIPAVALEMRPTIMMYRLMSQDLGVSWLFALVTWDVSTGIRVAVLRCDEMF